MKITYAYTLVISLVFVSCSVIKETSKRKMDTGIYSVSTEKKKRFYTVVEEDSIKLYPAVKTKTGWLAYTDTVSIFQLTNTNTLSKQSVTFIARSFDIDILTIIFKYRPSINDFPNQLNTNFNGAGYLGYRSDYYAVSYDKNPLNVYDRTINHFAFSIGCFGGLGTTNMNPFVTNNQVQSEYDGLVISSGIVGLIGVGNLTFGGAIGIDHLMDRNHKFWIYQQKLWLGFTVGLNLN